MNIKSNNGSQHLSALTKDEVTAPHVNLGPSDLPGDLYKYVADHVWARISETVRAMSSEDVKKANYAIDTLADIKKQIHESLPNSERRKELVADVFKFKTDNAEAVAIAAPVFWYRITKPSERRKIVKRNIMTLPYGSTSYGLGQQVIDDAKKHGIDYLLALENKWGAYLGREVYEDCRISLERPMRLLSIFEAAGKVAEKEGRFLGWTVPVTNFPVVQHYAEGTVKKIWVQYGPPEGERDSTGYYENTYQLNICFIETQKPAKHKQSQGASPNAIHSLDAAHLMLTIENCPFTVTTIHDSYGCLLGDMAELYVIVRESFLQLYQADPLTSIMKEIDGNIAGLEMGTLDLELILDSEYAFA